MLCSFSIAITGKSLFNWKLTKCLKFIFKCRYDICNCISVCVYHTIERLRKTMKYDGYLLIVNVTSVTVVIIFTFSRRSFSFFCVSPIIFNLRKWKITLTISSVPQQMSLLNTFWFFFTFYPIFQIVSLQLFLMFFTNAERNDEFFKRIFCFCSVDFSAA